MLTRPAARAPARVAGFTIIEMMVTLVLLGILLALAMPSFTTWVRNSKLRAVGDSLQNGLRLAQTEATRRNRQVVFTLTNDKVTASTAADHTAAANGNFWSLATVQAYASDAFAFIESGVLTDVASGVQVTGPAAICFSAMGRLVANPSPGITGASCSSPPAPTPPATSAMLTYDISFADAVSGVDRPMRVTVALGGQVRMCDPAKALGSTNPDGCP